jgi:hypothetical protein
MLFRQGGQGKTEGWVIAVRITVGPAANPGEFGI